MRRAAPPLIILIALWSSGCAGRALPPAPPAPVVLPSASCPAPSAPALPAVDGGAMLDSPANVAVLLERESRLRRYIKGLRAALDCYGAQTEARHAE